MARFAGGRKFFRDDATDRIAVADESGNYPHEADEGVLWLDISRPIIRRSDGTCSLPLLRPDGSALLIDATQKEGDYCRDTFRMLEVKP
jgi:hypothetical protein